MNNAERARARFALALQRRVPDGPCPSPEDVLAWHENTLDGTRRGVVQTHVARCDSCFAMWSGLVELDAAGAPGPVPQRAPSRWRWLGTGRALPVLVAGVAAVALWFGTLNSEPLPGYDIQFRGALETRGTPERAQPLVLRNATALEIVATPRSAVDDAVAMAVFAQVNERLQQIEAPISVTGKGVAALEGTVGEDILVPPGTTRLLIVVGRRAELPDAAQLARALGSDDSVTTDHWRGWSVPVTLGP